MEDLAETIDTAFNRHAASQALEEQKTFDFLVRFERFRLKPPIAFFAAIGSSLADAGPHCHLVSLPSRHQRCSPNTQGKASAAAPSRAQFALMHAFWLIIYPSIGYSAAAFGTPLTFTVAGTACLLVTVARITYLEEQRYGATRSGPNAITRQARRPPV